MKKTSLVLSLFAIFIAGLFFTSCSSEKNFVVEKRHYGKGYYVHSNGNRNEEKTSENNSAAVVVIEKNTAASDVTVPANSVIENNVANTEQNIPIIAQQKMQHQKSTPFQKRSAVTEKNSSVEKISS